MGRIRTVKPELFTHAELYDAEHATKLPLRLAFVALFTCCDREGRFKWRPRELKLNCLPFDSADFEKVMTALASHGFVVRYGKDGEYGFIPSWHNHQTVNIREAKSSIPEPPQSTHVHARERDTSEHIPNGVNIPDPLRQTVIARDGGKCVRCDATEDLTIDHIFPRSIGGTHAIANLRTMCRSCNSGRPVAGKGLVEDLARDGFTLEDMQRTCTHVHARGEGKGREGKGTGKEGEGNARHDADAVFDAFYSAYPNKKAKGDAINAWAKLNSAERALCLPAIEAQVKAAHFRGRDGQDYTPYPATWLNARRWEDEIKTAVLNINGGMTREEAEAEMTAIRIKNGRDPVMGRVDDEECSRALLIYRGVIKEPKAARA